MAKLTHRHLPVPGAASASALPTATAEETELTSPGVVLGTVDYMSPEQAMGMDLDGRTDLFSFGGVLYEMATGTRPFKGNTTALVFNAILSQAPTPPVRLNPAVPDELERLIAKALEKNREMRYQSAKEMLTDLKRLKRDTDSGKAAVSWAGVSMTKPRVKWLVVGIGAGLALIVLVVILGLWILRQGRETPAASLVPVPLTSYPGSESSPSFSPDGNQVAFSWNGEKQDNFDIYIKLIGSPTPLRLTTDPAEDVSPAFSPDGRSLLFSQQDEVGSDLMLVENFK